MFQFEIIQTPSFAYSKEIIQNIFSIIDSLVDLPQQGTLNIVFVSDSDMQELNKNYRQKDSLTDVLSFHYYDDFSNLEKDEVAGEVILSESKIKIQGKEYGLGEEKEFYKLLIHSILHILGYDHEDDKDYKIMHNLEAKIWQEVFEK